MSSQPIDTAFVEIRPDTGNFIPNLQRDLNGAFSRIERTANQSLAGVNQQFAKVGTSAQQSFAGAAKSAEREFKRIDSAATLRAREAGEHFGGIFTTTLKRGAQVAGAAVGAVLTGALVKGFSRLTAIDDARAKLTGLGHDTKTVQKIMDNAMASVKGTAFGFGEAASLSAGMVAAGIQPGKDLERVLKLVGDSATIAGSDLGEMGAIWGKVAATGRLQGDEMQQLTERGIPILQLLAKHYGVTAGEAAKMVSKGKVDFKTFSTVMEGAMGGAALKSGETFSGSMRNVGAALSRLGAGLMGGAFSKMPGIFADLISWIDRVTPAAKMIGEKLGVAFARAWEKIKAVVELLSKGDFNASIRKALKVEEDSPLVRALLRIRDTAIGLFSLFAGDPMEKVRMAFNVEGAAPFLTMLVKIRDAVTELWAGFTLKGNVGAPLEGFVAVGAKIRELLPTLLKFAPLVLGAGGALTILGGKFTGLGAVMGPATGFLSGFISKIPLIGGPLSGLVTKFGAFLPALGNIGPKLSEITEKGGLLGKVVGGLKSPLGIASLAFVGLAGASLLVKDGGVGVVNAVNDMARQISTFALGIAKNLPSIMATVVPAITGVFTTIATVMPQLVSSIVTALVNLVPALIQAAVVLFSALVTALGKILPVVIQGLVQLVMALVNMLPTLIPVLINGAVALLMAIVQAIDKILPPVITAMLLLVDAIVKLLPTLIPALLQAGIALLMALVNAADKIIPALINAAIVLINAVIKMLPTLIPILLNAAVTLFLALVNALPKIIPMLIQAAIALIMAVVKMLPTLIPILLQAAITLFMALVRAVPQILTALLKAMGDVLSGLWTFISGKFTEWKTSLGKKWDEIVANISAAWKKLQEAAKTPIKWVIEHVINNGIIKAFNWLSDKIGGPQISPVSTNFAKGGVVPGYSPGQDKYPAMLSPGEAVMRPEWTRAVGGPAVVAAMNSAAIRGLLKKRNRSQEEDNLLATVSGNSRSEFGVGGLIEWINDRWQNVKNAWDWVTDKASAIWQAVTHPIDFIKNMIGNWKANLPGPAKQIVDYIEAAVGKGISLAVDKVKALWTAFQSAFSGSGAAGGGTVWPVGHAPITAPFGRYPVSGLPHRGVDFGVPTGTLVRAFRGGRISASGWSSTGFGNQVRIDHGKGYTSIYGHNRNLLKRIGEAVVAGAGIAYSDNTGHSFGSHLHFEIRKNGVSLDPMPFLRGQAFDRGGWLRPGLTMAYNSTGKPERVLSAQESTPAQVINIYQYWPQVTPESVARNKALQFSAAIGGL